MSNASVFEPLGFSWDRGVVPTDVPTHSVERAVFRLHKSLPEYVWDAAALEGNPFTLPEVQTLIDGVTVGGHRLGDERQVVNLVDSSKELIRLVKAGEFTLDKPTSDHLHEIIAHDEAFDAGHFRGEGTERRLTPTVALGPDERHVPPATEAGGENLRQLHARGLAALAALDSPYEQGLAYFLFGAVHKFYFDGNKRTARFMMNGHLMAHGIDAISVPATRRHEFNARMVDFYRVRNGTAMFAFLTRCHPDADLMVTDVVRAALA